MTLAVLNLLSMGAGESTIAVLGGARQELLETCSSVDWRYLDRDVASDWREGISYRATPEADFLREWTLRWIGVPRSIVEAIEADFETWLDGGGVPFLWEIPRRSTGVYVLYRGRPRVQVDSIQSGSAVVVLEETANRD